MMGIFIQTNADNNHARSRPPVGYIIQENGCWDWVGALSPLGYGSATGSDGKTRKAHRVIYERVKGAIPAGLELDHLCRNPSCVNPDHLEPVSHRENCRRGNQGLYLKSKSHCHKGHALTPDNLLPGALRRGSRSCRKCHNDRNRSARLAQREAAQVTGL